MVHATERPHRQYGSAIFVKANSVLEATSVSEDDDIQVLSVELSSVVVTSIYKPPAIAPNGAIRETNKDGEAVEESMDTNQLSLIHNPKLPSSFHSARWRCGYNPDLAAVTGNIVGLCEKIVLISIPASQNRPIGIQVNAAIRPTSVPLKRRFNYKQADWKGFTSELEQNI